MLDAIVCKRCGMAYFPHSAEDKAAHTKYHNYTTSALRLRVSEYLKSKWKKICFILEYQAPACSSTIPRW